MDEIDILRAAHLMIDRYDEEVEEIVCGQIDDMMACGDMIGESVWKRILVAVKQLQRENPASHEMLH